MSRKLFLVMTVSGAMTSPTLAQSTAEGWSGFLALGPAVAPDYDGADEYRILPFAAGTLKMGRYTLEVNGAQARLDLVSLPGVVAGPAVGIRLGRDEDADGRVGLLDEVDTAVEAGAFVGLRYGGNAAGEGEVQIDLTGLVDVADAHDGIVINGTVTYVALRRRDYVLSLDVQATYGSSKYMRTYFGVAAPEAARSGLAAYEAESSLQDIGAGATIGYQFSARWGVLGRISYAYLVGDAADSPIVTDEGSRHQGVLAAGLSYRF